MESLRKNAITNLIWSFTEQLLRKGASSLITILLAWFLLPEDYGLMGIIGVFLAVSFAFVEGGYRPALIRKKEVSQDDLNTVFYTNIALSLLLYLLLWIASPWIAKYYNQNHISDLLRVAGISLIFQSFSIVHSTMMQRKLMFRLQAVTNLPASIGSGIIAVAIAYLGGGVWAIIFQILTYPIINGILFWRTRIWNPTISFSLESLKSLSKFSILILMTDLQREFFARMYIATIAKSFALEIAGLYSFAEKIRDMVVQQLVAAVQQVTYPALSKIQGDDKRLLDAYRQIMQVSVFAIYPFFLCLSALSKPLFGLLLPIKWIGAAPYLQIMLISALLVPLHRINGNIIQVKNKPNWMLWLGLFESASLMAILYLSHSHGVYWILYGHLSATFLVYCVKSYFTRDLISYSYTKQIADVLPTLLVGLFVFGSIWLVSESLKVPDYIKLLGLGSVGFLAYLALAHIFRIKGYLVLRGLITERFLTPRKKS